MAIWKPLQVTVKSLIYDAPNTNILKILELSSGCLCRIPWSQMLSREWRSNYIRVIDNFIAYQDASYIRDFTVVILDGHGGARQVSHKATGRQSVASRYFHVVDSATHSNTYLATSGPKIRRLFYFIRAQNYVFMNIQSVLHPPATFQYHREPTVSARFVSKRPSGLSTLFSLPSIGKDSFVAIFILPPKNIYF